MRIETPEDIEKMRNIMGERGVNGFIGCLRVLEDGGEVWIFLTEEEVNNDPDLQPNEKAGCLYKLRVGGWDYTSHHRTSPSRQLLRPTRRPCGCEPHGSIH